MQETTKNKIMECIGDNDFFFIVAGKNTKNDCISASSFIHGDGVQIAKIIAKTFEDYPEIEEIVSILRKNTQEILH